MGSPSRRSSDCPGPIASNERDGRRTPVVNALARKNNRDRRRCRWAPSGWASQTGVMSEPKSVRPPQATVAGWLIVGGSVVVVLMALGQGAVLRSLDTREAVEDYLSRPPGDQLGLGVQGMLTLLRVVWTVTAVSGAAAAVLGWYVLQPLQGRAARAVGARGAAVRHQLLLRRVARSQRVPGDGDRRDRDAVVPARPGLVRRHHAGGPRAAGPAARRRRSRRPAGTRCSTSRRRPRRRCTPRRTPPSRPPPSSRPPGGRRR